MLDEFYLSKKLKRKAYQWTTDFDDANADADDGSSWTQIFFHDGQLEP